MSTGDNVRLARCKKGLSQGDLADLLGVSLHTIFRIENWKTDLGVELLKPSARFYK